MADPLAAFPNQLANGPGNIPDADEVMENYNHVRTYLNNRLGNLTDAQLLIANSSGQVVGRTLSGDVTVNNLGVATIGANAVGPAEIADGSIDSAAQIANGIVTPVKLSASPYGLYRRLLSASSWLSPSTNFPSAFIMRTATDEGDLGTWSNAVGASAPWGVPSCHFEAADHDLSAHGLTTKIRVSAQCYTGTTGPGRTITVGAYRITANAGNVLTPSLVTSATASFASPAANAFTSDDSGDVAVPSDGEIVFAVTTSGAISASSGVHIAAQLDVRNVPT